MEKGPNNPPVEPRVEMTSPTETEAYNMPDSPIEDATIETNTPDNSGEEESPKNEETPNRRPYVLIQPKEGYRVAFTRGADEAAERWWNKGYDLVTDYRPDDFGKHPEDTIIEA